MFTSVRSRRTAAQLTLGLVAALASVGCGGGGGGGDDQPNPTEPPPTTPPTQAVTSAAVTMRSSSTYDGYYYTDEHRFAPASVTLKRGGTVTWTNDTNVSHNVTFSRAGAPADVASHTSGSNARTFATTGSFAYSCTNHSGMSGTISVVD